MLAKRESRRSIIKQGKISVYFEGQRRFIGGYFVKEHSGRDLKGVRVRALLGNVPIMPWADRTPPCAQPAASSKGQWDLAVGDCGRRNPSWIRDHAPWLRYQLCCSLTVEPSEPVSGPKESKAVHQLLSAPCQCVLGWEWGQMTVNRVEGLFPGKGSESSPQLIFVNRSVMQ